MDDDNRSILKEESDNEEIPIKTENSPNPEWDGSQAAFVEDDDAGKFDEEYSGIRISYKLTKDEICQSIKRAGYYTISRGKTLIETAVLVVALAVFLGSYFVYGNTVNIIMSVVCAVVLAMLWLIPHIIMRREVRAQEGRERQTTVEFYPDEIEVSTGDKQWEIQLNATAQLEEYDDMFILYLPNTQIFPIPIRAIEPSVLGDIGSMLKAGTKPREKRSRRR